MWWILLSVRSNPGCFQTRTCTANWLEEAQREGRWLFWIGVSHRNRHSLPDLSAVFGTCTACCSLNMLFFCFPMPFPQVTRLWAATSQCLWLFLHELGRSTRGRWAAIDVESKERKENIMFVADSVWHVFITAVYCVPEELVWSCWAPTWFWNRAVFLCWRSILGHLRGPESRLTCPEHISGKIYLRNLCATEWAPAMT